MTSKLALSAVIVLGSDVWSSPLGFPGCPGCPGQEDIPPLEAKVADMKKYAWEGGSWQGGNNPTITVEIQE